LFDKPDPSPYNPVMESESCLTPRKS
jgi:hypothetical protein